MFIYIAYKNIVNRWFLCKDEGKCDDKEENKLTEFLIFIGQIYWLLWLQMFDTPIVIGRSLFWQVWGSVEVYSVLKKHQGCKDQGNGPMQSAELWPTDLGWIELNFQSCFSIFK